MYQAGRRARSAHTEWQYTRSFSTEPVCRTCWSASQTPLLHLPSAPLEKATPKQLQLFLEGGKAEGMLHANICTPQHPLKPRNQTQTGEKLVFLLKIWNNSSITQPGQTATVAPQWTYFCGRSVPRLGLNQEAMAGINVVFAHTPRGVLGKCFRCNADRMRTCKCFEVYTVLL